MIPKASLYDRYQLSNSSAIPMFEGSAGAESIQVGQYKQGQYDTALDTAGQVSSASDNVMAMKADQGLADDLRNSVQGKIDGWAKAKDWENYVPQTKALAREYTNRATELARPLQQYQEWRKANLEDDKLGLDSDRKATFDQMALAGYKGLKKDQLGRFTGSFTGPTPDKVISYTDRMDKWMKDIAIANGGSEIAQFGTGDKAAWKVKRGNTWESLDAGKIKTSMDLAMANDPEWQASVKQDAKLYAFKGMNAIKRPEDLATVLSPSEQMLTKQYLGKGYGLSNAVAGALAYSKSHEIERIAKDYAVTKYQRHNVTSNYDETYDPSLNKTTEPGATIVTDSLDNPAVNYEDLTKDRNTYTEQRKTAGVQIDAMKNTAKSWYENTHGTGTWDKLSGNETENQIQGYYKTQPGGSTMLAALDKYRNDYTNADKRLSSLDEADKFVESYVLNKLHGTSAEQLNTNAKNEIATQVGKVGSVRVLVDDQWKEYSGTELAGMLKDATMTNMNKATTPDLPDFLGINSTTFNYKGKKIVIQDNAVTGKLDDIISKYGHFGADLEAEKKKYGNEAMKNYSQSTGLVALNNDKLNKLINSSVRGGEKVIYDNTGRALTPGTDEEKLVQSLIEAGDYSLLGTYTENKGNQNAMVKVSVRNTQDKEALPKTYRVGLKTLSTSLISNHLMQEAVKGGKVTDHDLYDAALALKPNSSYNKINRSKIGTVATVKDATGSTMYRVEKSTIDGQPSIVVVDKDGNKVEGFNGQMNIGSFLDQYTNNSAFKVEYQ